MPAMPPLPQQRWVILAGIPKVVATEDTKGGRRRVSCSIFVAGDEFPCASVLTVPTRVSTAPTNLWYPYIAAADPSGMLLLCATQPLTSFSRVVSYHRQGRPDPPALADHGPPRPQRRPSPEGPGLHGRGAPAGRRRQWPHHAALLHGGQVRTPGSRRSSPTRPRSTGTSSARASSLTDPFADAPELLHVRLPSVPDELPAAPVDRGVYRCVKVSDGRLRHVQVHGSYDAPVVTNPAAAGDWVPVRSVPLADVWADQSYLLNTSLPQSFPALALLHPTNPDKVFFFLRSCIFAVDLRLRKVVAFNDFWMPEPPPHLKRSSHFVHIWQNHPSDRPDILPCCFNRDKFSIGPNVKRLMKRFAAAKSRSTAVMPPVVRKVYIAFVLTCDQEVPGSSTSLRTFVWESLFAIFPSPDPAVREPTALGISLKRTLDFQENIEMEAARREQLQAKSRMKEGAESAVDDAFSP